MIDPQRFAAGVHNINGDGRKMKGLSVALVDDYLIVLLCISLVDEAREVGEGRAVRHWWPYTMTKDESSEHSLSM